MVRTFVFRFQKCVKEGAWGKVANGAAVETGGPTAEIFVFLQASSF